MANRFDGETCVICPNPSIGVGEHVWPLWFLQEFEGEGPFYTEKSGEPITKRDRSTATHNALWGAHVPMCETCNTALNQNIEIPAKEAVRRLIPRSTQHSWPAVTADEAGALGRWFLKVALLLSHEKTVHDQPQVQRDADKPLLTGLTSQYLEWMRDGTDPPYGFSVYAQRRSIYSELPWQGDTQMILLPQHVRVGQHDLGFASKTIGIRGVDATIVWHPGWPIRHPLVENGRAVRLWPEPEPVDFAELAEVHAAEFTFASAPGSWNFTDQQYQEHLLPPLEAGVMPMANASDDSGS